MLALVLAAAVAPATPTPVPAPSPAVAASAPVPSSALADLAAFEGTWTCERRAAVSDGVAPPVRYELRVSVSLNGFWYSGRMVEEKSETHPHPATRLFFWGHDDVLGKYVGGWLDDRGGWSAQTAMPWEEDKLVFLGHVTTTGERVTARETFTRPHGGAFVRRYEILGFIEWGLVSEDTCRKVD